MNIEVQGEFPQLINHLLSDVSYWMLIRATKIPSKKHHVPIGTEHAEGNMEPISPGYVSRMFNVPQENVEKCMASM